MSLPAGTRVGRYEMHSLIGEGGMGQVYLARDTQLDRVVALKILPSAVAADPQRLNRFLQEARAASKISGAHAAHIYEIGEASDVHFIAMEYVEGDQLAARIAAHRHTPAQIVDIGAQIAEALEEAHARGVTHRDIKPQNVIVTPRGQAKVLDFGLAKLTDDVPSEAATRVKTNPGAVMGTVSYMSPEQALGREDVDSRTDIFSLGVVLYEMATGRLPFEGGSVTETIDRIVHAQPEAIARFNYEVPAELEVIIRKALRKDRDERYQTVRDMGTDLRSLARELGSGEDVTSSLPSQRTETPAMRQSASSAEYLVEGIRRHKTGALAALALIVLAATVYGVSRYAFRAAPARFEQVKLTRITTEGNLQSVVVSPDGKYIAYALLEAGKRSLWTKHLATDSRVQIVPPTEANKLDPHFFSHDGGYVFFVQHDEQNRSSALFQVAVLGGPPKKILTDLDSPAGLSPDGRRLAFARYRPGAASEQYQVWLADADGSNERRLWAGTEPQHLYLNGLSWSPDGKLLAVDYGNEEGGATMATIAVTDGTFKVITPQRWDRVGRIAWFGDGSGMAVAARERGQSGQSGQGWQIWRVSYPEGEARRITNDLHSYGFHSLTLTADSRTLVALQVEGTVSMWIAPQGDARRARDLNVRGSAGGLDWTPDGRLVLTSNVGGKQHIGMMDADGGELKPLTQGGGSPQVSADGRYIFYTSRRSKTEQVWRVDSDGSHPKQLTDGDGVETFALTPDGRWVIYSLYAPTIWKISTDGGAPSKVADAAAFSLQVSRDGKLFAYAGVDAQTNRLQLAVLTVNGGTPVRRFDLPVTARPFFRWSPDSRAFIYIDTRGDVSNLWRLPLDGGKPVQVTDFTTHIIQTFAYSRDGRLALSRGSMTRDALMIQDEK